MTDHRRLRELCAAATPSEAWTSGVWYGAEEGGWASIGPHHDHDDLSGEDDAPGSEPHQMAERDAEFIAAARTALPQLLDDLDSQQRDLDAARAECERWRNCIICIECGRTKSDDDGCCTTCGRDCIGFIDGKLVNTGVAAHFDALQRKAAPVDQLYADVERLTAERGAAVADGVLSQRVCDIENDRAQLTAERDAALARCRRYQDAWARVGKVIADEGCQCFEDGDGTVAADDVCLGHRIQSAMYIDTADKEPHE